MEIRSLLLFLLLKCMHLLSSLQSRVVASSQENEKFLKTNT